MQLNCQPKAVCMDRDSSVNLLCQAFELTEAEALECYGMTKLPVVDETFNTQSTMYNRLQFVEFQELLIRAGIVRFKKIESLDHRYYQDLSLFGIIEKTIEIITDNQINENWISIAAHKQTEGTPSKPNANMVYII